MSSSSTSAGRRWHYLLTAGSVVCISQGSVVTVLIWGGQNYSRLHQVFSWCCMPKIIKIGHCFSELFKKIIVARFYWPRCIRFGTTKLRDFILQYTLTYAVVSVLRRIKVLSWNDDHKYGNCLKIILRFFVNGRPESEKGTRRLKICGETALAA